MLVNLQSLRALAAIAVVVFHFGLLPATSLPFQVGAAGVDLFFVLSGFIIAHSSSRDARHFLPRRLIRILPAYWIATIIAALFTLRHMDWQATAGWAAQSLFHLPGPQGRPPLIFVAWTLVYELAFYLIYWLAIRIGGRQAPLLAFAMTTLLAVIRLPGLGGPWPLFFEFGLGLVIYLMWERRVLARSLPVAVGIFLAGIGAVALVLLPRLTGYNPNDYQGFGRVLNWGLPAGAIVLGLVIAEDKGLTVHSRTALLLGAASYAIYLLHPIAVGQLVQLPSTQPPLSWFYLSGAVMLTGAASVAFHLWIEAPLLRRMRGWLDDRPPIEQRLVSEALKG